jgi:hypothetical protein
MFRKLFAAAGAAALLAGLGVASLAMAGAASASTTYTAVTSLTNRPDSGNNTDNGGDWAVDTLTRTATLVDLGVDPHRPSYDTYSFALSDTGTFVTDAGVATNPNGLNPLTLLGADTGTVKGTGTWTNFDVPSSVHPVSMTAVPTAQDGAGTPSSDWLGYFFPKYTNTSLCPGTGLDSVQTSEDNCGQETQFSYLYTDCNGHWLDANTDADGNAKGVTSSADLATIGGISGAACPAPTPSPTSPSPTSTPSGTPAPSTFPVGGVTTGGGKAPSSPLAPVGEGLAGLAGLGLLGMGIRRVRNSRV